MSKKIDKYIKIENKPEDNSKINASYYEYVVGTIKKIHKMPKFPKVSSREIYHELRKKDKPRVESNYPLRKWTDI